MMKYTGERMIPAVNKGWLTYSDHYARYLSIQEIVAEKSALDIACGTGYGTKLIAETAVDVLGVDIDPKTIEYCRENFNSRNIKYKVGSTDKIPAQDQSFDVIVSFETIEHLKDHKPFYLEAKRVMRPNGLFICSMPNAKNPLHGTNEFHLSEQTLDGFEKELKTHFQYVDIYLQNIWITSQVWSRQNYTITDTAKRLETLISKPFHPDPDGALVFLAVASQKPIDKQLPFTAVPSSEDVLEMILTLKKYKELDKQLNARIDTMENYIRDLERKVQVYEGNAGQNTT